MSIENKLESLAESADKAVSKITEVEEHWSATINRIEGEMKEMKENSQAINKESVKEMLTDALSRMDSERINERTVFGVAVENKLAMPNTWDDSFSSAMVFGDTDPHFLCQKGLDVVAKYGDRKFTGLDTLLLAPPADDHQKHLQRLADDVFLVDSILRLTRGNKYTGLDAECPKLSAKWQRSLSQFIGAYGGENTLKNLYGPGFDVKTPAESTSNPNWIPTGFSAQLRELVKVRLVVATLFEHFNMPTNPWKLPVDLTDTVGEYITEASGTNPYSDTGNQTLVDAGPTFDAAKMRGRMITSGELNEDSIIAMLPFMRRKVAQILANNRETATLNGDTTATHMDNDITGTHPAKGIMGIRKMCIDGDGASFETDATGGFTEAEFGTIRKEMGEYGVDPGPLVYIVSIDTYLNMVTFPNLLTVDKYGQNATLLTGEVGRLFGIPVIVSRYQRNDTDATTGTNTVGGPNTLSVAHIVHTGAFAYGDRRDVTLEAERWITTDQWNIVAFERLDFKPLFGTQGAASMRKTCWMLYNMTN